MFYNYYLACRYEWNIWYFGQGNSLYKYTITKEEDNEKLFIQAITNSLHDIRLKGKIIFGCF